MTTEQTTGSGQAVPPAQDVGFAPTSYDLTLDYRVSTNRLDAVAVVRGVTTRVVDTVSLSLVGLRVTGVLVDGRRAARWRHRGATLDITLAAALAPETALEVTVTYNGGPRPLRGPWGEVGWEELADGVLVAGQPDGAASWFPCVNTPSAKAAFRTTVTAESAYMVVCNGALLSRTPRAGRCTWVYEMPEPMAPYLATLQVGRYATYPIASHPVPQTVVTPPALSRAVLSDLSRQAEMMDLFCWAFGPYPFAEYTVVVTADPLEIPVEAQGIAVFGSNHLDGTGRWERLVAHELAHQWFGNSLTVATWSDIWLHEGFACYAEWLWSEASGAATATERATLAHARLSGLDQDLRVGNPDPERMFDDRVYKRGALTLHALRVTVGDDAFFRVLRAWAAENRHGSIGTAGLITVAERESGESLGALFDVWLDQEALPPLPAR